MGLVMARVDNRLVHGQVLEGWVPRLGIQVILVVDRSLVQDPIQRMVVEGIRRMGPDVRLVTPGEAAKSLEGELSGVRVLALFAGLAGALEALEAGVDFSTLNLGNIHPRPNSRKVTDTVYVTAEDVQSLWRLLERGVEAEVRAVPNERSQSIRAWLAGDRGR